MIQLWGGETEVEKEEYGLMIMDGGECNCNTGFMAMSWTVLEVLVTGVLAAVAIMMAIKGVMRTISLLKEVDREAEIGRRNERTNSFRRKK